MTDRSYLPYQSARDFQDRGMAKWAGFFPLNIALLWTKELDMSQLPQLDRQENSTYSVKPHSQQVPIRITFLNKERLTDITATIFHLTASSPPAGR